MANLLKPSVPSHDERCPRALGKGGGVSGWRERGREKERGMKTNQSRVPTHTPLSFPDPCLEWLGSGHAQSCVKRND